MSFLILFLFQLLLFQKVLIGFEFFKFCDFWLFAIFKSFSQCHGRWYRKTKLSNYTWIRDVQLLCKLSIQSSRWIWFNESSSVGHFLFIIQHQIIFIIFYSLRYLHLIFYLLSTYFFFIILFLVFSFHFFVLFIYLYLFYFIFFGDFFLILTSVKIEIENIWNSSWERKHAQRQLLELHILQVILTLRRFQDWLLHDLMNID